MKTLRRFNWCLCVLWMLTITTALGEQVMSNLQVLERSRFKKDFELKNSDDVYIKFAELLDNENLVDNPARGVISASDLSMAWLASASYSRQTKIFTVNKNTTLIELLERIAVYRKEVIVQRGAGLIIFPASAPILRASYKRGFGEMPDMRLLEISDLFIPLRISIIQPEPRGLEDFITDMMRQTCVLKKLQGTNFRFRIDDALEPALKQVCIIGNWTYGSFAESICILSESEWKIDGSILSLVPRKIFK